MQYWHTSRADAEISPAHPIAYADRLRIRQPGDSGFALGPHVDGGSVERWEQDGYGKGHVYDKIFQGKWEEYDPWESSTRIDAVSDLYSGAGACSMLRMFQGWLSMSTTAPNEGTLLVNPLFSLSTAYFLLRPFFTPVQASAAISEVSGDYSSEFLDSKNWVFEEELSSVLQGASLGHSQELNNILHPHLRLQHTMVHVPKIDPGDYVAWHCDSKIYFSYSLFEVILTTAQPSMLLIRNTPESLILVCYTFLHVLPRSLRLITSFGNGIRF